MSDPAGLSVEQPRLLERLLARDRLVIAACLAAVTILAWLWLLNMSADMTATADMSGMDMGGMDMPGMAVGRASDWSAAYFASTVLMWFVMMVAMMLPSALPMILLYGRTARGGKDAARVLSPTLVFAGSYIAVWAAFSLAAAFAQWLLVRGGLMSDASLALGNGRVAGALLVVAGIYQVTSIKRACLTHCRSPFSLLMKGWRPGWRGAVRLGATHGLYCIGCCWMLMALLFVGGVMNLVLVAALAVIVLIEKAAPFGRQASLAVSVLAIAAGGALILGASFAGLFEAAG